MKIQRQLERAGVFSDGFTRQRHRGNGRDIPGHLVDGAGFVIDDHARAVFEPVDAVDHVRKPGCLRKADAKGLQNGFPDARLPQPAGRRRRPHYPENGPCAR